MDLPQGPLGAPHLAGGAAAVGFAAGGFAAGGGDTGGERRGLLP
jgi:hypothetical protein